MFQGMNEQQIQKKMTELIQESTYNHPDLRAGRETRSLNAYMDAVDEKRKNILTNLAHEAEAEKYLDVYFRGTSFSAIELTEAAKYLPIDKYLITLETWWNAHSKALREQLSIANATQIFLPPTLEGTFLAHSSLQKYFFAKAEQASVAPIAFAKQYFATHKTQESLSQLSI